MYPIGRSVLAGLAALLLLSVAPVVPHADSLQFTDVASTDIDSDSVNLLRAAWKQALPAQSDAAPLYVTGINTGGAVRDLLIVETDHGQVLALDADDGHTVWQTNAPLGVRWTTSTPAVDPERRYVYAYCLDGYIHRYAIADGREAGGPCWPALITTKTDVEKGSSAIRIATARDGHEYLYMPTAAYPDPGDEGDYQGHVTSIDLATGGQWVFNAACSDTSFHLLPTLDENDCDQQQSGIWARAGLVYDPSLDRTFVTIGNGVYDASSGGYNWGSSVVALKPDGSLENGVPLDSYTPEEYQQLTDEDLDLSASAIEILPEVTSKTYPHLGVQIGKDGVLRLLNLADLSGQGGPRHVGGELAKISGLPWVLTRPVAWRDETLGQTSIFVTNSRALLAFGVSEGDDGSLNLFQRWSRPEGGTSPVIANGMLFYAATNGLYAVSAQTGELLWNDDNVGPIHWQTPIVAGNALFICDGDHMIWRYDITEASLRAHRRRFKRIP